MRYFWLLVFVCMTFGSAYGAEMRDKSKISLEIIPYQTVLNYDTTYIYWNSTREQSGTYAEEGLHCKLTLRMSPIISFMVYYDHVYGTFKAHRVSLISGIRQIRKGNKVGFGIKLYF